MSFPHVSPLSGAKALAEFQICSPLTPLRHPFPHWYNGACRLKNELIIRSKWKQQQQGQEVRLRASRWMLGSRWGFLNAAWTAAAAPPVSQSSSIAFRWAVWQQAARVGRAQMYNAHALYMRCCTWKYNAMIKRVSYIYVALRGVCHAGVAADLNWLPIVWRVRLIFTTIFQRNSFFIVDGKYSDEGNNITEKTDIKTVDGAALGGGWHG